VRGVRQTKALPAAVRRWSEQRIGPVTAVRDASHDWYRSRVWELEGEGAARWYVKVSPSVKSFTRETRAYRHVVPALGQGRTPHLVDTRAQDLAVLLTTVPGVPAPGLGPADGEWRAVHRQAGTLCARLHEAGALDRDDRAEAEASLQAAADGAEKYLARAGDRLTEDERQVVRDHAAQLRRVGPVPVGYVHGDNQLRNILYAPDTPARTDEADGSGPFLAVIDLERSEPGPAVRDLVRLSDAWHGRPELYEAFLAGYGRHLTPAEEARLVIDAALDSVSGIAYGAAHGDPGLVERGRRTLARLHAEHDDSLSPTGEAR
jgi:aminoglycoside phosphotransferase (APT) family kinase protein